MKLQLADNIRSFRKERSLTQEQLAEVLGVTVGAVHKWETRLSVPELPLIMEMADFFDTSVDALLGYEMKDNRLGATEERLWRYYRDKDRAGLIEIEKALKRYPNAFNITYVGASFYHGIGLESKDKAMLRRALELYNRARQLLPQNRDTTINEQILCGSIAQVYGALGEMEKGVRLLQEQNAGNLYSALIGTVLANEMNRPEEALSYLSRGLMQAYNGIIYTAFGFAKVYSVRHDCENGQAIIQWAIRSLRELKTSDAPDFADKVSAVMYVWLASFQLNDGNRNGARESLKRASELACRFDAAPYYGCQNTRFLSDGEQTAIAYDTLGQTAMEAVENAVKDTGNEALSNLYRRIDNQPEKEGST